MAERSVVWTETALQQRRQILKYWTLRNKSTVYAEKLLLLIRDRISLLVKHPMAGKPTSHSDIREAAMGNFSIFYKMDGDQVIITSFWDNRQDPEKLLEFLRS